MKNIKVRPEDIYVPENVRKEFIGDSILEMRLSLRNHGQLQAIGIQPMDGKPQLVYGERRLRAALLEQWPTIDAVEYPDNLTAIEIRELQLTENLLRQNLSAVETGLAIHQQIEETGQTAAELASRLGVSPATVSRWKKLLVLPDSILSQIRSGTIPPDSGCVLARVKDPVEQAALAAQVASGQLTRDALTGIVKSNGTGKTYAAPKGKPGRFKAELSGGRSIVVSGSGLDNDTLINWLEELLAKLRRLRSKGLALATIARLFHDEAKT